jgi:hypothetical protein
MEVLIGRSPRGGVFLPCECWCESDRWRCGSRGRPTAASRGERRGFGPGGALGAGVEDARGGQAGAVDGEHDGQVAAEVVSSPAAGKGRPGWRMTRAARAPAILIRPQPAPPPSAGL